MLVLLLFLVLPSSCSKFSPSSLGNPSGYICGSQWIKNLIRYSIILTAMKIIFPWLIASPSVALTVAVLPCNFGYFYNYGDPIVLHCTLGNLPNLGSFGLARLYFFFSPRDRLSFFPIAKVTNLKRRNRRKCKVKLSSICARYFWLDIFPSTYQWSMYYIYH